MKIKYLLITFLLATCANAHAEWFLRGTHNSWAAAQMAPGGTNTVELKNVVFSSPGSVKFDRFGDWTQNYGVGGLNGGNIPVAAGTWNIRFFTDTKNWNISRAEQYHLRGTHNNWAEGDFLTPVAGSATNYEACRNFGTPSAALSPRFKVDINGGWGTDAFPMQDYSVFGWTKIIVNGSERKVVSVTTKLPAGCTASIAFANPGPITLRIGETFRNPVNMPFLEYTSSNSAVAEVVIYNGIVTAVGVGTATITGKEEQCYTCTNQSASYVINIVP